MIYVQSYWIDALLELTCIVVRLKHWFQGICSTVTVVRLSLRLSQSLYYVYSLTPFRSFRSRLDEHFCFLSINGMLYCCCSRFSSVPGRSLAIRFAQGRMFQIASRLYMVRRCTIASSNINKEVMLASSFHFSSSSNSR